MKKNIILYNLFLASLCVCLTISCKKDSGSGFSSYIKGKLNGVSFQTTSNIWATPGDAGNNIISFRGDWPSYSIRFYMEGQGSAITTGSYDFVTGVQRNAIVYENNDGYSAGYFFCMGGPCILHGSGRIIISEISKKYIKGTFEFVTDVSPATGTSKSVTDGEFYIKRE